MLSEVAHNLLLCLKIIYVYIEVHYKADWGNHFFIIKKYISWPGKACFVHFNILSILWNKKKSCKKIASTRQKHLHFFDSCFKLRAEPVIFTNPFITVEASKPMFSFMTLFFRYFDLVESAQIIKQIEG